MLKNRHETVWDITYIYVTRRNGETYTVIIDTEDLPKLHGRNIHIHKTGNKYVRYCPVTTKGAHVSKDSQMYLSRFLMGDPPGLFIDHINGNTLDNRKENLRALDGAGNQQNRKGAAINNISGIRGVTWREDRKKWRAIVCVNGKNVYLGHFTDKYEAELVVSSYRETHMPFSADARTVEY